MKIRNLIVSSAAVFLIAGCAYFSGSKEKTPDSQSSAEAMSGRVPSSDLPNLPDQPKPIGFGKERCKVGDHGLTLGEYEAKFVLSEADPMWPFYAYQKLPQAVW